MLKDLLENRNCFKLVCGAGNENSQDVERLVYIYAKAGCRFFDLSANTDVISAAKKGYLLAQTGKEPYFCVSFGIKGDPHINKAHINIDICKKCKLCEFVCPQQSIKDCVVAVRNCIGCQKCVEQCKYNAIEMFSSDLMPSEFIRKLDIQDISCIELHATSLEESDLFYKWNDITAEYDGMLSICIDRLYLGNNQVLNRIKKMIANRTSYTTIIQADGIPMSGSNDDFKTTLQAVAMAEIIQDANLPAYILLSGGTNSKTTQLANMCGIHSNGVAIGSYARKIVKEFTTRDDFFENKYIQEKAVEVAKNLINTSLKYMNQL